MSPNVRMPVQHPFQRGAFVDPEGGVLPAPTRKDRNPAERGTSDPGSGFGGNGEEKVKNGRKKHISRSRTVTFRSFLFCGA